MRISFVVINKTYVSFAGDHTSDRAKTDINFHVSFQYMGNLVVYFSGLWSSNILVLTYGFSPRQRLCDYKHITINKLNRQSSPQFY